MEAGYTFLLTKVDDHLWVIISDPAQDADNVLVVNVTRWREVGKDQACMIERGEHPFVTHTSCMAYIEARVLSLANLLTFKDGGYLKLQEPVSEDLLERMRQGAVATHNLKPAFKNILRQQALVP